MIDRSWPEWNRSHGIQPREWPFALVGPGRVGSALSRALSELGFPAVAVAGGDRGRAESLAQELGAEVMVEPFPGLGDRARLIILTPPDRELEAAAHSLAEVGLGSGTGLIQTSAALPSSLLENADPRDQVLRLSFHPLKPFPDRNRDLHHFLDTLISIEGDDQAFLFGESLALLLGAHPIRLSPDMKSAYHAAGVMALTGVMALAWAVERMGDAMDLEGAFMTRGILPGMRAAIDAVETHGLPGGLTGPISRGDAQVVADHLEEIAKMSPDLEPLYRQIVLTTLRITEESGQLDSETAERLHTLLDT